MTDKKKPKSNSTALTVRMSRENLFKLKSRAAEKMLKLREYVHSELGLEMEEKK